MSERERLACRILMWIVKLLLRNTAQTLRDEIKTIETAIIVFKELEAID